MHFYENVRFLGSMKIGDYGTNTKNYLIINNVKIIVPV